jgi:hypothetical protein
MSNEQEPILGQNESSVPETKTSKEFLSEIYDMTDRVNSCKNNPTENNAMEITECISFIKKYSSEIEKDISENSTNAITLVNAFGNYCLDRTLRRNDDGSLMEEQIKENVLKENATIELLAFLNGMTKSLSNFVSDSFSEAVSGNTSAFHTVPAYHLAKNYLRLSLSENVGSEEHSILNAVRVIEPLGPILEKLKETRVEESPLSLISAIKRGNYLLLHIGDPKIIQEYVDDFVNDEEIEDFDFLSYENLFPADERTSYWNDSIHYKLLFLAEEGKSGYSEFELRRARQILNNAPREKITADILRHYQLPYQPMANAWIKSSIPEHMGYWHGGNLQDIRELEKENLGNAKKLYDTNGICCFSRYDKDFLLEQLNPPSEGEPRGLMASCYNDWNSAFSGYQMKSVHKKIQEGSENLGIKLRAIEYYDTTDLFYRLQAFCAKSENDPEIERAEYVWINQHGDKIMSEGEKNKIEEDWNFVFGIGENRSSLIIKEGGIVACLMCSGGEKDNVMDVVAKEYDITTVGPSDTTQGINSVSFKRNEETGKLSIDIDYNYYTKDPNFTEGKTIRYDYGNKGKPEN